MRCFYCGWNGFRQMPNHAESNVTFLTQVQMEESVDSVSCSWSALCIVSGSNIYISGFIDGAVNDSMKLTLENKDYFYQVVNNSKHIVAISSSNKDIWRRSTTPQEKSPEFSRISLGELTDEDSKDTVEKVSCSDNICVAMTKSGKLYAIPSRISDPSLVVTDVACGNEHTVFVTTTGSVYTFGQGSRGQLGHGELESEDEPREVDALSGIKIKQVSSGAWHCAVVSEEGDLYTWGWNRFGQLGVQQEPEPEPAEPKPQNLQSGTFPQTDKTASSSAEKDKMQLEGPIREDGAGGVYALPELIGWTEKNVVLVSCGTRHTVVLLEDNTIWGCGWNAYGQLGISPQVHYQRSSMTQIPIPTQEQVRSVVCGGWSTCVLVS